VLSNIDRHQIDCSALISPFRLMHLRLVQLTCHGAYACCCSIVCHAPGRKPSDATVLHSIQCCSLIAAAHTTSVSVERQIRGWISRFQRWSGSCRYVQLRDWQVTMGTILLGQEKGSMLRSRYCLGVLAVTGSRWWCCKLAKNSMII
jgi:hypothetical protein